MIKGQQAERWEDLIPVWQGPSYRELRLRYHSLVETGDVAAGGLNSCLDVVDWDGDGGRDLLISSWDACYGAGTLLFEQQGVLPDGTPRLTKVRQILGSVGYVSVVPDGKTFHLLATSRLRRELLLFPNVGGPGSPSFGDPRSLTLEADWRHEGELLQNARFADIDGDGSLQLVVGTEYLGDYWPDGAEWFDERYVPYTPRGDWRGGPIRGHLYLFRIRGDRADPRLTKGVPLKTAGRPIEVYGMPAPTFGDFRGTGVLDLVCGDMLDRLHFFPGAGAGSFGPGSTLRDDDGAEIVLSHCFHCPVAVDWDGDGRLDLLVSDEEGYVSFLRNTGHVLGDVPVFTMSGRVQMPRPALHAGVFSVPAVGDVTGTGRLDLVVGSSSGDLLFYPKHGGPEAPFFGRQAALRAGGETIRIQAGSNGSIQGPSECKFGYTCPTLADWDNDGRLDLLVSDIHGRHLFYRNLGKGDPPEFAPARELTYEGKPLRTVWRVRPAVIDWLGDGSLSYVCLDEDGILACYRRSSETVLEKKRLLCFEDGRPIGFTEDFGGGRGRIKLSVCDWTGNGRYDVLYGCHSRASVPPGPTGAPRHTTGRAGIFLLENVGDNSEPRFSLPRALRYRGEPIMLGMHSCSPEAVDWEGKNHLGLLVGAENGDLLWFPREDLSW